MTSIDLVHQKLPEALRASAMEYVIDDGSLENHSDLVALVLNSKSIEGKEEKQSWFSLLPVMDQEQISKLFDILHREQEKIQEIEQRYEEKKTTLIQKYTDKTYSNPVYQNTINKIKQEEAQHEAKDDADADKLLDTI